MAALTTLDMDKNRSYRVPSAMLPVQRNGLLCTYLLLSSLAAFARLGSPLPLFY
jgi:hypothetical protein